MKNQICFLLVYFCVQSFLIAQFNTIQIPTSIDVNGSNPDPSAILDIKSDDQGILIPRMSEANKEAISNPAEGLMVFDIDNQCISTFSQGDWSCLSDSKSCKKCPPGYGPAFWRIPEIDEDWNFDIVVDDLENQYVVMDTDDADIRLSKHDCNGELVWEIVTRGDDYRSLTLDQNQNVFSTGEAGSNFSFNGYSLITPYPKNVVFIKTAPNGQTLNMFAVSTDSGTLQARDIVADGQGNIYGLFNFNNSIDINGQTYTSSPSGSSGFIKLDNDLNVVWVKIIDESYAQTIDVDPQNGIVIGGSFQSMIDFDSNTISSTSPENLFIVQYDFNGNYKSAQYIGSDNSMKLLDVKCDDGFSYAVTTFNTDYSINGINSANSYSNATYLTVKFDNTDLSSPSPHAYKVREITEPVSSYYLHGMDVKNGLVSVALLIRRPQSQNYDQVGILDHFYVSTYSAITSMSHEDVFNFGSMFYTDDGILYGLLNSGRMDFNNVLPKNGPGIYRLR